MGDRVTKRFDPCEQHKASSRLVELEGWRRGGGEGQKGRRAR